MIRGQEARSDVFVDGLRDPGMTIRESFAIEQLEISKGPNSSFAGRGTSGGAINAITKQATRLDFNRFGRGRHRQHTRLRRRQPGDDRQLRDPRQRALRLRGCARPRPADRERKGLALSGLYTPTDNSTPSTTTA